MMDTDPRPPEHDEPDDANEEAHEHGVVFAQVEDDYPLRVEDLDGDDDDV
jgi:hypothetical protein